MSKQFMNTQDAPSAKQAEFFCTINGRRYSMLNAKKFEAKANVKPPKAIVDNNLYNFISIFFFAFYNYEITIPYFVADYSISTSHYKE